jgi:hypothetical protein
MQRSGALVVTTQKQLKSRSVYFFLRFMERPPARKSNYMPALEHDALALRSRFIWVEQAPVPSEGERQVLRHSVR